MLGISPDEFIAENAQAYASLSQKRGFDYYRQLRDICFQYITKLAGEGGDL